MKKYKKKNSQVETMKIKKEKISTKEIADIAKKNIQISIVCPMFYHGDAVGHSAHDYYRAFRALGYTKVRGIGARNDFPAMEFELCENSEILAKNKWFKNSDLVIYHYAIYHDIFEVLRNINKKGKHVVCFHNVTPKHLTPKHIWEIIDKSFQQIPIFKNADALWVDSRENLEELMRQGVNNLPFTEIPIAVDRPDLSSIIEKPKKQIDLLCIGRFFVSKGILDIVDAIALVKEKTPRRFILRLVGNTDFSDQVYIQEIKDRIQLHGLGEHVDFIGKVDEKTLSRIFRQSHVLVSASYHEGFCVPVIEALRAGMIPVTYNAANLRWIASGHGRTVETSDIPALADAMVEVIDAITESFNAPERECLPLDKGTKSARQFAQEAREYSGSFSFDCFTEKLNAAIIDVLN